MLKAVTKLKQRLNISHFTKELVFIVTINKLVHKLMQVFIFIKQSAIENNMGP